MEDQEAAERARAAEEGVGNGIARRDGLDRIGIGGGARE